MSNRRSTQCTVPVAHEDAREGQYELRDVGEGPVGRPYVSVAPGLGADVHRNGRHDLGGGFVVADALIIRC